MVLFYILFEHSPIWAEVIGSKFYITLPL